MTKELFLKQLRASLSGMNTEEIKDIMADFEEHFEAGKEDGRSEEEIAKLLGEPEIIANQLKVSAKIKKAETSRSVSNITRAVLATLGLGALNLIFVVGPYFGLVGVLFGLFGAGIGIFAAGFVSIIAGIIVWVSPGLVDQYVYLGMHPAAIIFLGVFVTCFGILFLIGCGYLTKWFYILTVKYLKLNLGVITGERESK